MLKCYIRTQYAKVRIRKNLNKVRLLLGLFIMTSNPTAMRMK